MAGRAGRGVSDRLGGAWRELRTKVIPLDAPAIQARECRRAFYAGANALLAIILGGVGSDPEEEATPKELVMMDELQEELEQFARDIRAGKACWGI